MSNSVDQRIVEMRFENDQFEKGIAETESSLKKFKEELDFGKIENVLDAVSDKFSVFGTIADQAIRNITNGFFELINSGKTFIESLSVDQIAAGFDKYARKTAAVQLIMNAAGLSAEEVNTKLEKLIWFSDETSYSFNDMVDSIAQFVATGMDIDTAITTIIGIADAAGYAAVGVEKASHAMTGFQKAMGKGYMDRSAYMWLRTSGINQVEFKERMLKAAEEVGTIVWDAEEQAYQVLTQTSNRQPGYVSVEDFESELANGWLNKEVMARGLADFGNYTEALYDYVQETGLLTSEAIGQLEDLGDGIGRAAFRASQEAKTFQEAIESVKDAVSSKWMTTFEYIFGNKDEAVELWTRLANELWDVFAASGDARNEMMALWKEMGGRDDVINGLWYLWGAFKMVLQSIKDAIADIFPPMTAGRLKTITERFNDFAWSIKMGVAKNLPLLTKTFRGLFAIIKIIGNTLNALVVKPLQALFNLGKGSGNGLLKITAALGDFLTNIANSELLAKILDTISDKIVTIIGFIRSLLDAIRDVFKAFKGGTSGEKLFSVIDLIKKPLDILIDTFEELTGINLKRFEDKVAMAFNNVGLFVARAWTAVRSFTRDLVDRLSPIWGDAFYSIGGYWSSLSTGIDMYGGQAVVTAIGGSIADFVEAIMESFQELTGMDISDEIIKVSDAIWLFTGRMSDAYVAVEKFVQNAKENLPPIWQMFGSQMKTDIFSGDVFNQNGGGFKGGLATGLTTGQDLIVALVQSYGALTSTDVSGAVNSVTTSLDGFNNKIYETIDKIKDFYENSKLLQDVADFFRNLWRSIAEGLKNLFGIDTGIGNVSQTLSEDGNAMADSLEEVASPWEKFIAKMKSFVGPLKEFYEKHLVPMWEKIKNYYISNIVPAWEKFVKYYNKNIKPIVDSIKENIKKMFGNLGEILTGEKEVTVKDILKAGGVGALIYVGLKKLLEIIERFGALFDKESGAGSPVSALINVILNPIATFIEKLKGIIDVDTIQSFANAVVKIALSVLLLASLPLDKAEQAVGILVSVIEGMGLALTMMQGLLGADEGIAFQVNSGANAFGKMRGLNAFANLGKSMDLMAISRVISSLATGMVKIAAALWIMDKIDPDKMQNSIRALEEVLGALAVFVIVLKTVSKDVGAETKGMKTKGSQFAGIGAMVMALSLSLIMIATALSMVAGFSWQEDWEGVTALVGMILVLGAVVEALVMFNKSSGGQIGAIGVTFLLLATSLTIIAGAITMMSYFSWDMYGEGFAALLLMVSALGGIVLALSRLGGDASKIMAAGVTITAAAGALLVISQSLVMLEAFDWSDLLPAVASLVILLGAITLAIVALARLGGGPQKMLSAAASFLIMAVAIDAISISLIALSKIKFGDLMAAVGAIAILLAAITAIGIVASRFVKGILVISAAVAILAASFLIFSTGLVVFGVGLTSVATGLAALIAIGQPLVDMLMYFLDSVATRIPTITLLIAGILEGIWLSIGNFLLKDLPTIFIEALPIWMEALYKFGVNLAAVLLKLVPYIVEVLLKLVIELLTALNEYIGTIVDSLLKFLIEVLNAIAANIKDIVIAIIDIICQIILGIGERLSEIVQTLVQLLIDTINAIADTIENKALGFYDAIKHLVMSIITAFITVLEAFFTDIQDVTKRLFGEEGMGKAIVDSIEKVKQFVKNLLTKAMDVFREFFKIIKEKGKALWDKLIEGIRKGADIVKVVKEFLGKAADKIKETVSGWYTMGKDALLGFVQGVSDWITDAVNKVVGFFSNIGTAIKNLFQEHSPSKVFMEIGRYVDEGFAIGVRDNAGVMIQATEDAGNAVISNMQNAMQALADTIDADADFRPVISPVLDLDDVEEGLGDLSNRMNGSQYYIDPVVKDIEKSKNYIRDLADSIEKQSANNNGSIGAINVYINGVEEDNMEDLADLVIDRINHEIVRGKAAYA